MHVPEVLVGLHGPVPQSDPLAGMVASFNLMILLQKALSRFERDNGLKRCNEVPR